ncbi:hypothetical protein RUM43_011309 [Polyplax serrata]|uniref:CSD domain-containing protein n=1 Tax=Polyplax serrata TaxID=468196 RepID=A0AAN8P6V9_POLSC
MAGAMIDKNDENTEAPKPGTENGGSTVPEVATTGTTEFPVKKRGKCKWFNVTKGWGFITPDDGSPDVFVHQSVIKMTGFRSLGDDEVVEFMCKSSDKGFEATHVSGIDDTECKGSTRRPLPRKRFIKIRCYNCGAFANHIAAKCSMEPQPKRCHFCQSESHLVADCPQRANAGQEKNKDSQVTNNGTSETEAVAVALEKQAVM